MVAPAITEYYSPAHSDLTEQGQEYVHKNTSFPSRSISIGGLRHAFSYEEIDAAMGMGFSFLQQVTKGEQELVAALICRHFAGGKARQKDMHGDYKHGDPQTGMPLDEVIRTAREDLGRAYIDIRLCNQTTVNIHLDKLEAEAARLAKEINPTLRQGRGFP